MNKSTINKIVEASQQVGAIKRQGQKKATEVLNDLMQTAMSFAATYQQKIMAAGHKGPSASDIDRFWKAMECAGVFAKALAPYQDPQLKAMFHMPTPAPAQEPKTVEGKVVRLDDPIAVSRVYQQTVKRIA